MSGESFYLPGAAQYSVRGRRSKKLAEPVAGCGVKRVLLVTDKGVRNAGLTKNAEAGLVAAGCELTVFDDVEADPPSQIIERAVAPALIADDQIEIVAKFLGDNDPEARE